MSSADIPLLRVPTKFKTSEEVLKTALQLNLPNVLVLSELPNGNLVFLDNGLSLAEVNWLLDRMKTVLLLPADFQRVGT